jgi:Lsr2
VAQQVNVVLLDDLDGSEASETVPFGLNGRSYEIDLSQDNATKLRDALAPYAAAARRTGGRRSTGSRVQRAPASDRDQTAAIRQWARENGHELSDRGRIPKAVMQAYEQRHTNTNTNTNSAKPRTRKPKAAQPV